jgi:hypothetical protein
LIFQNTFLQKKWHVNYAESMESSSMNDYDSARHFFLSASVLLLSSSSCISQHVASDIATSLCVNKMARLEGNIGKYHRTKAQ